MSKNKKKTTSNNKDEEQKEDISTEKKLNFDDMSEKDIKELFKNKPEIQKKLNFFEENEDDLLENYKKKEKKWLQAMRNLLTCNHFFSFFL